MQHSICRDTARKLTGEISCSLLSDRKNRKRSTWLSVVRFQVSTELQGNTRCHQHKSSGTCAYLHLDLCFFLLNFSNSDRTDSKTVFKEAHLTVPWILNVLSYGPPQKRKKDKTKTSGIGESFTQRWWVPPGFEPPSPSCCCCSRGRGGNEGSSGRSCGPAGWKPHPPQTEPWCPASETPARWTGQCTSPAEGPQHAQPKGTIFLFLLWQASQLLINFLLSSFFSSFSIIYEIKNVNGATDHPLHHFVHQQLLFGSGQQEKVMRLLNNHRPQSVHHVCGKLLNGAHPARGNANMCVFVCVCVCIHTWVRHFIQW